MLANNHLSRNDIAQLPLGNVVACSRRRAKSSNPCNDRNQQYSIVGLTNAAGTLVERYTYTAYGTLGIHAADGSVRTSSSYNNRYTYTGREWDPDLKLYHFRARWYDPSTGGFISRDPLGYVDGLSLYRGYFGVRWVDPNGMFTKIPSDRESEVIASVPDYGEIFQDSDGQCYYYGGANKQSKVNIKCPNRKFVLFVEDGFDVYQGVIRSYVDSLTWLHFRIPVTTERPDDALNQLHQGLCRNDFDFDCVDTLILFSHGDPDNTLKGAVPYDQIATFFSRIAFCRPCLIVIHSCKSHVPSPNRQSGSLTFAEKVRQETGCEVMGVPGCIKHFGEKAIMTVGEEGRNEKVIARHWNGCFVRLPAKCDKGK